MGVRNEKRKLRAKNNWKERAREKKKQSQDRGFSLLFHSVQDSTHLKFSAFRNFFALGTGLIQYLLSNNITEKVLSHYMLDSKQNSLKYIFHFKIEALRFLDLLFYTWLLSHIICHLCRFYFLITRRIWMVSCLSLINLNKQNHKKKRNKFIKTPNAFLLKRVYYFGLFPSFKNCVNSEYMFV